MAETLNPGLEEKKKAVSALVQKMKDSKTVLIASTKGLPSSQFHQIKKNLRGKAEVKVAKKSLVVRAITQTEKGSMQQLKENVQADTAIFFSNEDAFELSGTLTDNMTPSKAKAGDIVPDDINVEPGPTDLPPGPAISELSGVGLKVAVENGKLAIKTGATIVKAGSEVTPNVASVLGKLNINPMKVGFIPIAAYDANDDKVYVGIKIDKEATLESLKECISKSLGFAVNLEYITDKTIAYFIAKAGLEGQAIEALLDKPAAEPATEEKSEEAPAAEAKEESTEENKEEQTQDDQNNKEEAQ